MFFILLTFMAALLIESLGTLVSVIGLSTLFGANPIIILLAISLDIGKLVVVSLLYKHWKSLSKIMRVYAVMAATVTMIITSAGASGYLAGEFQKAIVGTQETALKVDVLKQQQAKYQQRKQQIDDQIAALPAKTTVYNRLRLMNGFKAEQGALDAKIADIDKQLPDMQIKQIGVEAKAGPIIYVAKAFNIPVEQAVKWVILMIIFVFDPLAVFLIISGNFLLERRKQDLTDRERQEHDDLFGISACHEPEEQVIKKYAKQAKEKMAEPLPEPALNAQLVEQLRARGIDVDGEPDETPILRGSLIAPQQEQTREDSSTIVDAPSIEPQNDDEELRAEINEIVKQQNTKSRQLPPYGPETSVPRETIKLSDLKALPTTSLSDVRPDPATIINATPNQEASNSIYVAGSAKT